MTTAAKPAEAFEHGDEKRYRRGCRCNKCTAGANAANQRRRYLRLTGRSTRRTPDRAADHVLTLRTAGLDDKTIKAEANVCCDVLYRIMRREGTIHVKTEQRILSVPVPQHKNAPTKSRAYISALGTHRRLRALVAAGWYPSELARRLGKDRENLSQLLTGKRGTQVALYQADEVHALYAELADQKPEDHGVPHHYAQRARTQAAARGWAAPGYWDEEGFDNPDYTPTSTDTELGFRERAALRREEIIHFAWHGDTPEQILARLDGEVSISTVRQIVQDWRTGQKRDRKQVAADVQAAAEAREAERHEAAA